MSHVNSYCTCNSSKEITWPIGSKLISHLSEWTKISSLGWFKAHEIEGSAAASRTNLSLD